MHYDGKNHEKNKNLVPYSNLGGKYINFKNPCWFWNWIAFSRPPQGIKNTIFVTRMVKWYYSSKKLEQPGGQLLQVHPFQDHDIIGLTPTGKVLMWLQLENKSYKIKPMDQFVGISIKKVACAPNVNLVCMISDRGILMTKGNLL